MGAAEEIRHLTDKIIALMTELKTRNELDKEERDRHEREQVANRWERRSMILTIALLAGFNITKIAGVW